MAGLTDNTNYIVHKFETDIRTMLRMDIGCNVEERSFRLQNLLINFVAGKNLKWIVEGDGEWTPEHGTLVVDAVVAGSMSFNTMQIVKISVEYTRFVDKPDRVFESMDEEGGKQQRTETCKESTTIAQHQQPAAPTYHVGRSMQSNMTTQKGVGEKDAE